MKKTIRSFARVILLGVLLAGCGGGAGSSRLQVSLDVTIAPSSLNLGGVPVGATSPAQTVTVTNNGSGSITVSAITISGPFASTGVTLPLTLNAGQSLTLNVTFTPTASGVATGTLTITSTAGNSPATVTLAGTGSSSSTSVDINPGMNIPSVVNANPLGTTFVIHPGVYRMQSIIAKDADVFVGQPGAILNGSEQLCTATIPCQNDGTNYYVSGQTQANRVNIPATQCETGWEGCIYPEDLYFDNVPLQHVTTLAAVAPGSWFFDYTNHIIYFRDNPAGHTVETSVTAMAFQRWDGSIGSKANNVTIQGLTIEKYATPVLAGALGGGTAFGFPTYGANWVVQNNEIRLNHATGVVVNFGWHVLNNFIHDNGDFGCCGGLGGGNPDGTGTLPSGVLIQGNEIARNNYAHVKPGFGAGGSKVARSRGFIYRGNYVHDNRGAGLWTDISNYDSLYDNNTIADNAGEGAFHEISFGTTVMRNNKLLRNGYTHPAVGSGGYSANLESSTSQGVEAYCNTIEVSMQGGNGMTMIASNRGNDIKPPNAYYISSGNFFHHNTVVFDGNAGYIGGVNYDPSNQPNFFSLNSFDYNTYHLTDLSRAAFSWNGVNNTFGQFQATGQDSHGTADTKYTSSIPTVTITSPTDGSTVSGIVTVAADAQDSTSISKVEFYVDWVLQSTDTSSPFNFSWNTSSVSAGEHTVAAMAYNPDGIHACFGITFNVQH